MGGGLPDKNEDDGNVEFFSIYNILEENLDLWEKEKDN